MPRYAWFYMTLIIGWSLLAGRPAVARDHEVTRDEAVAIAAANLAREGIEQRSVSVREDPAEYRDRFPHRRIWSVAFGARPERREDAAEFLIDRDTGDVLYRAGCCG